ncbi:hypothetical protein RND81_05G100400 [Saponaria officinalis]|uniref:Uncharacterized protein n=1 Tax=Saponaria officinalis TaxID=3572 RepID=A0AAW1KRY5_SAPOF
MYEHLKTVILPKTRYDWIHLRLQDFKSIFDYNSTINIVKEVLKNREISHVTEQNNKILLKNHQSRPTGSNLFPDHASSRGRGHGYRQGRGNNFGNYRGGRGGQFKSCDCKGHWSRTYRTRKHFVDLYQQSLNNKRENKIEANFAAENDTIETNFADGKDNYGGLLDVSDFFSNSDGRIDHLIGDGSVQKQD